jgi:hypothetical protein
MGIARFIAVAPYKPVATEAELADLIAEMHGGIDCTIHADGDVSIEND